MNKISIFFVFIILINGCSFNKNSKFWTASQNISEEKELEYKEIFTKEEALEKEFNVNISLNLGNTSNNNSKIKNYFNNEGRLDYNGVLKKSSRYKFSKINNFYQFEPKILFVNKNILFFDNKGSIVKFDQKKRQFVLGPHQLVVGFVRPRPLSWRCTGLVSGPC